MSRATERNGRMAKWSRGLILAASLALGLMYVLPVWTIDLEAPQYPEGLGMVIGISTIEGKKPHDLNNINNLNHYIGMRRIEPESIPELSIMPVVVAVLMLTGLLVGALGRRRPLYAWTAGFLLVSMVGIADFWKWEYDYGHDLDDENAIIKIPGMSYQPPLIGSRQILNFEAHSWPGAGGLIAMLAAATAVAVSASEMRRGRRDAWAKTVGLGDVPIEGAAGPEASSRRERRGGLAAGAPTVTALAVATMVTAACGAPEPRALLPGVDGCADCLMVVDANGHGAEIVMSTGKIYTFDSVECMANHLAASGDVEPVHSLWVTDFAAPEALVPAEEAYYLVSPTLGSPMGLGVTAFGRAEDRDGAIHAFGGRAATWSDVRALVATAWPEGRPSMKHGGHTATAPLGDPGRVGG